MTVTELFPTLRNLPRADKLKVMQFLVTELAQEEEPTSHIPKVRQQSEEFQLRHCDRWRSLP
jgi:hypothetical protein